jgi:hypothetical protein
LNVKLIEARFPFQILSDTPAVKNYSRPFKVTVSSFDVFCKKKQL